jgi:hypothetical protein
MKPTNVKITREGTIARLKAMGLPGLPVAPIQDAQKFPARDRSGAIIREANGQPKPAFTGKNPSYLDAVGNPQLIAHRVFQNRLPSDWEMQNWFAHPANGVMTMGGWQHIIWIDIDVKRYSRPGRCDQSVRQWLNRYPALANTWIERTHSGGWRFAIQVEALPQFSVGSDDRSQRSTLCLRQSCSTHPGTGCESDRLTYHSGCQKIANVQNYSHGGWCWHGQPA